MFELYSVPSLTYCVDGIMSFYQNNLPVPTDPFTANGLVISFNTASTSVIPILRGKGVLSLAKRYGINSALLNPGLIGGSTEYHGARRRHPNTSSNLYN